MKMLRVILLVFVAFSGEAQTVFKADMKVQKFTSKQTKCFTAQVIWAIKDDSICFVIDRQYCYTSQQKDERIDWGFGQTVLVKDESGRNATIRYVGGDGILMYITGIEGQFPFFVLSTHDLCK